MPEKKKHQQTISEMGIDDQEDYYSEKWGELIMMFDHIHGLCSALRRPCSKQLDKINKELREIVREEFS